MVAKKHTSKKHPKKDFSQQLDDQVEKFATWRWVKKVVKNSLVASLLESSLMDSLNESVRPHFKTIASILGVLALIWGAMGILGFLGGIGSVLLGMYGGGMIVVALVGLVWSLLALIQWRGLLHMKTWVPYMVLVWFVWSMISIIINEIFWSSLIHYWRGGNYWVMFIISLIVLFFILKNRDLFTTK